MHYHSIFSYRISILSSVHQKSRVSGSSGFGTRSSNLTDLAQTVEPSCSTKPTGNDDMVKNGYSSISKFSKLSGVLRFGVPANRNIPAVVFGSTFREHPTLLLAVNEELIFSNKRTYQYDLHRAINWKYQIITWHAMFFF